MEIDALEKRDSHGVKIPFTKLGELKSDELQNRSVEYQIPIKGGSLCGVGTFLISAPDAKGLYFVQIATTRKGIEKDQSISTHHYLPQWAIDRIRRHPDQAAAEFLLT